MAFFMLLSSKGEKGRGGHFSHTLPFHLGREKRRDASHLMISSSLSTKKREGGGGEGKD